MRASANRAASKPAIIAFRVLLELVVENYAVVERLRVPFHAGLNLLTGETGSGKSIVVDALGLLLGARASADMIRTGETRARVGGIFDVREQAALRRILEPAGLEIEEGELLIEREILANGKSRAFVGSRPVSAALLRELAPCLAEIHGQHNQQLLFSADAQREMLDAFAAHRGLLSGIAAVFSQWRSAATELEELERGEQEKLRLLDLWSFQRKEIEEAGLKPGEDAALENERRILQNVQRLEEAAAGAYSAVYDGDDAAVSRVRAAAKRLDELCRIDPSLEALREHLLAADLSLQEVAYGLRDYLGKLEANPGRLDEVENRLAAIDRLKRKYGSSIAGTLAFLEDTVRQIDALEHSGERMEELRRARQRLGSEFETLSGDLRDRRAAAARKLEKRVEAELAQLSMERTVFRVEISTAAWSAHGADRVEFLVSPNLGADTLLYHAVSVGLTRAGMVVSTLSSSIEYFSQVNFRSRSSCLLETPQLQSSRCSRRQAATGFSPLKKPSSPSSMKSRQILLKDSPGFELIVEEMPPVLEIYPKLGRETKDDPFEEYPKPAVRPPMDNVLLYLHSSGSTGFPKSIAETFRIMAQWASFRKSTCCSPYHLST